MFKIDYWYKNGREARKEIAFVNVSFYPNEGLYRGNLFDSNKKAIGDLPVISATPLAYSAWHLPCFCLFCSSLIAHGSTSADVLMWSYIIMILSFIIHLSRFLFIVHH